MTSWTSIEQEKCNQCGLCVTRCPGNYREENDTVMANARLETCSLCGHCVALCPTGAIAHDRMDMENFLPIDHKMEIDSGDFFDFVRARRSVRHFRDEPIPRADLERLVDLCRYAPTGANKQSVEILVFQDREKIATLSSLTVDFYVERGERIERAVKALEDEGKEIPPDLQAEAARSGLGRGLVFGRSLGKDVIFHRAPAVMLFHSPLNPSTPKDDCVIAAQTTVLAAMTLRLDTCYIGLFDRAAREGYPPVLEALELPEKHTIGSVIVLGYPKMKFQKTVDRRPMPVRWE